MPRRGLERCWTTFTVREQRRAAEQQVKRVSLPPVVNAGSELVVSWAAISSVLSSRYQKDKEEAYITHTPDKDEVYIIFWKEART